MYNRYNFAVRVVLFPLLTSSMSWKHTPSHQDPGMILWSATSWSSMLSCSPAYLNRIMLCKQMHVRTKAPPSWDLTAKLSEDNRTCSLECQRHSPQLALPLKDDSWRCVHHHPGLAQRMASSAMSSGGQHRPPTKKKGMSQSSSGKGSGSGNPICPILYHRFQFWAVKDLRNSTVGPNIYP